MPGIIGLQPDKFQQIRILAVRWPPNCGVSELKILKI
jgi:hypothetical protein